MEAVLAFAGALVALRLAAALVQRYHARRMPALAAWAASLAAYGIAAAALAWGSAAGWSEPSFRVYYLFGGLLTAPLLGVGSLLLLGWRWTVAAALLYAGLVVGIAVAVPLTAPVGGTELPAAGEHLDFVPARAVAVAGNSLGTLAVVAVAVATIRRRPLGNALIVAGVVVAAAGTAPLPFDGMVHAGSVVLAALLLYAGFLFATGARLRARTAS